MTLAADVASDRIPRLRVAPEAACVPECPAFEEPGLEVWRDPNGEVCAWAERIDGERWMHIPRVARYRLRPTELEVAAVRDPSAPPPLVVSAYRRTVLPMAIQLAGREVLHASGVLTTFGAVAFCAVSMTGKSTIALRLSGRGYSLWADDAVAFDSGGSSIRTVPLPFELRLRAPAVQERDPDDATTSPTYTHPVPLAAVCVLERIPGTPADVVEIVRLPPAQAFPALLTHAYCYSLDDPQRNRRMIQHYLDLSDGVPVFRVRFRAGLEHLPTVLEAIERAVGAVPGAIK